MKSILLAVASPLEVDPMTIDKAARLASAFEAEIELFHCVVDAEIPRPRRHDAGSVEADIHTIVESRHQQLGVTASRLRAQNIRVRTSVQWDYPAHEGIVRQVLRHKPALVIAQSTRRNHAASLVLTYTDFKLIETCPCPVLLVKTARPYGHVRLLAAVDPEHMHEKPAALDDAILEAARAVSSALSGELLVVHARMPWTDAVQVVRGLEMTPEPPGGDARSAYMESVKQHVVELARRHEIPEGNVQIVDGNPVNSLPQFVCGWADIVVMGAVSRSLFKRILIGHTAERLLDVLDCDLLIVKPAGFRSPVRRQSAHRIERESAQPRARKSSARGLLGM